MSRLLVTPYSLFAILVSAAVVFAWQAPAVGPAVVRKPAKPQAAAAAPALADGVIPLWELSATKTTSQAADDATERTLQAVVDVDFRNEKLRDVLKRLSRDGKRFRMQVDRESLKESEISLDRRVTLRLKGFSIEHVLLRVLEPNNLTWAIRDGVVEVTAAGGEGAFYSIRVYSLGGLESPEASLQLRNLETRTPAALERKASDVGTEYDWVLNAVTSNTGNGWRETDGMGGSLMLVNKTLIVEQSFAGHREVSELLRALRIAAQGKLQGGAFDLRHRHYPYKRDRHLRRRLAESATIRLKQVPLDKALSQLEQKLGVSFWMDAAMLKESQIALDTKVSLETQGMTWQAAIQKMLRPMGLGILVDEGTIRIINEEGGTERLSGFLFDIRDLLKLGFSTRRIEELILNQSASVWKIDGDPNGGSLSANPDLGIVIVRQTRSGIRSIAELLQNLRANLEKSLKPTGGKLVPSKYLDRVELRYYEVSDGDKAKELAAAIPVFVEPQAWKTGSFTPAIKVVEGTLIIRQTVKVHQAIQAFLHELDPPVPPNGGLGGLGGGLGGLGGGFF